MFFLELNVNKLCASAQEGSVVLTPQCWDVNGFEVCNSGVGHISLGKI